MEKYKSARTGEATPSSVKKTPMRTSLLRRRRRLAEVEAAALAYDEEVQAASVAEEPAVDADNASSRRRTSRLPSSRRVLARLPSSPRHTNRRRKVADT